MYSKIQSDVTVLMDMVLLWYRTILKKPETLHIMYNYLKNYSKNIIILKSKFKLFVTNL